MQIVAASCKRYSFALCFSVGLLALVALGFAARAIVHPELWPPVRPSLVLHIVVMVAWFLLVVVQVYLIDHGRMENHRRLGAIGALLSVLVVITCVVMIVELNARQFLWLQVISNAINVIAFAVFFCAAIVLRRNREAHMRMMLFASLALMTPALARLFQPIGAEALALPIWLALGAGVAVFDVLSRGRVARITWFGLLVNFFFAATLTTSVLIIASQRSPTVSAPIWSSA